MTAIYVTIFRLVVWPYLKRMLANRSAEFVASVINSRRRQRVERAVEEQSVPALPASSEAALVPVPTAIECPPPQTGLASRDIFWYTMSGILLGSVFGFVLALVSRPKT